MTEITNRCDPHHAIATLLNPSQALRVSQPFVRPEITRLRDTGHGKNHSKY